MRILNHDLIYLNKPGTVKDTMPVCLNNISCSSQKCVMILAIRSSPKFAILSGHSRMVHFAKIDYHPVAFGNTPFTAQIGL